MKKCIYYRVAPNIVECYVCRRQCRTTLNPEQVHTYCGNAPRAPEKKMPSVWRQAWDVTAALAAFVGDRFKMVSREEYKARLETCDTCEWRRNNRCVQCGCRLSLKARARAFKCPAGKWDKENNDANHN